MNYANGTKIKIGDIISIDGVEHEVIEIWNDSALLTDKKLILTLSQLCKAKFERRAND